MIPEEELSRLQMQEKRDNPKMIVALGKSILFLSVAITIVLLVAHYDLFGKIPVRLLVTTLGVIACFVGFVALIRYIIGHDDKSIESEDGIIWKNEEEDEP